MEPLLQDGSIAFVDTSQRDAKKSGVFMVETTAGVFIKRLRLRADNKVELISENPTYPVEVLLPEEVRIVGRVVGSIERI